MVFASGIFINNTSNAVLASSASDGQAIGSIFTIQANRSILAVDGNGRTISAIDRDRTINARHILLLIIFAVSRPQVEVVLCGNRDFAVILDQGNILTRINRHGIARMNQGLCIAGHVTFGLRCNQLEAGVIDGICHTLACYIGIRVINLLCFSIFCNRNFRIGNGNLTGFHRRQGGRSNLQVVILVIIC